MDIAKRRVLDYCGLLLCVVTWGSAYVVIKSAAADMTALTMALCRLIFAAAFFLPLAVKYRHFNTAAEIWQAKYYLLALSLLGTAGYVFVMCLGLKYTTAANGSLINGINPIVTVFAAALFTKTKIKKSAYLPLILAVAGAVILIWFKPAASGGFSLNPGDLLFVVNMILWSAFSVVLIPFNNRLHWAVWGFIINAFGILVLLLLIPFFPVDFAGTPPIDFVKLAYVGLICGGLDTVLWNNAIGRLGIATTALFNNLNPLAAVIFAVLFLGETMVLNQVLGAALILGSLISYTLIDFIHFKRFQRQQAARLTQRAADSAELDGRYCDD